MAQSTVRPLFAANLEELSRENLIAMVRFYRSKEKRSREEKLGLTPTTTTDDELPPSRPASRSLSKADGKRSDTVTSSGKREDLTKKKEKVSKKKKALSGATASPEIAKTEFRSDSGF